MTLAAAVPVQGLLKRWLGPWVAEVDQSSLRADVLAGLLGAVLVLPQAIAFAALAGLPPAMGLAAAVLPCAVAALAGSSRQVVSGPSNAVALALGAMLLPLAAGDASLLVPLALALTLLVGLMQTGLALARLGALANFIAPSVMLGFTSGAAGLIAWYALAGLMGAAGRASPAQAWDAGLSWPALLLGGLTLCAALAGRRWWRRGPHMLLALGVGTAACWWISQPGVATWLPGAPPLRVGHTASAWPQLQWLQWPAPAAVHWSTLLPQLLSAAMALTIVALGQAMAIAKALGVRTGQTINPNRECLGQGLANISAALSGGMVVCGSLNRSLPNLEAGARTPLAAVASAVWLVGLVALAGPLLAWIPLAGVAALLLVVAATLVDQAAWARAWQHDRSEFGVAAATAAATLVLRLEVAVLAGVMLSLVVYLYRTARPALRSMGFDSQAPQRPFVVLDEGVGGLLDAAAKRPAAAALPECPQLKLLRMEGSVWFGAVPHVADHLGALRRRAQASPQGQRHLLVMAKSMNTIDMAAADLWDNERARRRECGGDLYFHRPRPPVLALWQRTGFLQRLGPNHVFADKHHAIATIVPLLDAAVCAGCTVRLFDECAARPGAPLDHAI